MSAEFEVLDSLPSPSWDLSPRNRYIRLGCISCPNAINIKASNLDQEEVVALRDICSLVEKIVVINQGSSHEWQDSCKVDECPEGIPTALELLNERFSINLE